MTYILWGTELLSPHLFSSHKWEDIQKKRKKKPVQELLQHRQRWLTRWFGKNIENITDKDKDEKKGS